MDIRQKELVTLGEEMKFVESFLYLHTIRFGNKLIFNNRLSKLEGHVPPLAIQMLVENAIKHNVISEDDPLTITVRQENDLIVIENNLQRRTVPSADRGIGLENISKRYEMLTDKKIVIEETPQLFIVKIPLLNAS